MSLKVVRLQVGSINPLLPSGGKSTGKTSKTRSGDAKRRILDSSTRERRLKRKLESLEKDNSHDDPHAAFAHLAAKTKLPTFSDGSESVYLNSLASSMCLHK